MICLIRRFAEGFKSMIDEELWKMAHLEQIHKELKSRWKRRERENFSKGYNRYELMRRRAELERRQKEADRWPRWFWRIWFDLRFHENMVKWAEERVKYE